MSLCSAKATTAAALVKSMELCSFILRSRNTKTTTDDAIWLAGGDTDDDDDDDETLGAAA